MAVVVPGEEGLPLEHLREDAARRLYVGCVRWGVCLVRPDRTAMVWGYDGHIHTMGLPLRTQTSTLLVYWQEESMISGARYQRVTTYLHIYGVMGVMFS